MNVKEIQIDKIKIYQNIRSERGDVSMLMKTMEQDGLLHPIGVYAKEDHYILAYGSRRLKAAKKLNWKTISAVIGSSAFTEEDFLAKNTIENIHREEVNPVELGRVCQMFIDNKFSLGEVAAKLHIAGDRVKTSLLLWKKLPKEYQDCIGYIPRGVANKGKIPAHVAMGIVRMKLSAQLTRDLLEYAKSNEMTIGQIYLIEKLARTGIPIKTVLKNLELYAIKNMNIPVNRRELEKLNLDKIGFVEYIKNIVRGDEPPNKNLLI